MYKFIFLIFLVVYVNGVYDEGTARKIFNMAASAYANVADPQGNASINACLNKSFNGIKWDLTQTITEPCGVVVCYKMLHTAGEGGLKGLGSRAINHYNFLRKMTMMNARALSEFHQQLVLLSLHFEARLTYNNCGMS